MPPKKVKELIKIEDKTLTKFNDIIIKVPN